MNPNDETKCGICHTPVFERNNYFYGKQLTVRDLLQEQNYLNEKRRLINRGILGTGVVCGLDVSWDAEHHAFLICTGLAIDCCGREILVCQPQTVPFDEYATIAAKMEAEADYKPETYVLCLAYRECNTEQVELPPVDCGCGPHPEYNRIRESFQFSVVKWSESCLTHKPGAVECPDHIKRPVERDAEYGAPCRTETLHHYLCGRLHTCPECCCDECVVLATVSIFRPYYEPGQEQTGPPIRVKVDACTHRRLVYRLPLLFDLVSCYLDNAPRIVEFSWRREVYPDHIVSFHRFAHMIEEGLKVTFDTEMRPASLNASTFIVSFLIRSEGTGSVVAKRIPVREIACAMHGDCFIATFIADPDWIKDELKSTYTELGNGARVEIVLRGSLIHSVAGRALDGDYINDSLPTGNGVQGGDFVDYFRVKKRDEDREPVERITRF